MVNCHYHDAIENFQELEPLVVLECLCTFRPSSSPNFSGSRYDLMVYVKLHLIGQLQGSEDLLFLIWVLADFGVPNLLHE
jgi:hypothetical protein